MKKSSVLFLCLAMLGVLCLLSSCKTNSYYREDLRESPPGYRNVTCNAIQDETIELYIENAISNTKDAAIEWLSFLQADYHTLENSFNLHTKIKCYLIADEYLLGNTGAEYHEGVILCTPNALQNKSYRTALTAAYIRSTEPWKQYGVYSYAFRTEYDNEQLKKRYADMKNDLSLTLFSAYFIESFSTQEEIAIAEETAASFGNFVIGTYGYDALIAADLTAYRTEYLAFLGIRRPFSISLDLSWLNGAEYSRQFLSYPLIIKTKNRMYFLDAISATRDVASFDRAKKILTQLSHSVTECETVLSYLKAHAPESYVFAKAKYEGNLTYFISESETKTCCDVNGGKIYLCDPGEYVHETAHMLTLAENPGAVAWLGEGVAEYLSRSVSREISDIHYRFYLSFTDTSLTGTLAEFVSEVNDLYTEAGGSFESLDAFDLALLEKCIGITMLRHPSFRSEISFPYATTPIYRTYACTSEDGNVLTYPEAYALTQYLIERYGESAVFRCCNSYRPEDIFGKSYEELFSDFMSSVSSSLR